MFTDHKTRDYSWAIMFCSLASIKHLQLKESFPFGSPFWHFDCSLLLQGEYNGYWLSVDTYVVFILCPTWKMTCCQIERYKAKFIWEFGELSHICPQTFFFQILHQSVTSLCESFVFDQNAKQNLIMTRTQSGKTPHLLFFLQLTSYY